MYRETKFVSVSTFTRRLSKGGNGRARARAARGAPNPAVDLWSRFGVPNAPQQAFGVNLASKTLDAKSFVFREDRKARH